MDERTAICVLTHDDKFDVPALRAALATPARYIGAMGSRRTTERRRERLLELGVAEEELDRIHAPIGLSIASRTPEEVAVAIGAQIVAVANRARHARPDMSGPARPPDDAGVRGRRLAAGLQTPLQRLTRATSRREDGRS